MCCGFFMLWNEERIFLGVGIYEEVLEKHSKCTIFDGFIGDHLFCDNNFPIRQLNPQLNPQAAEL